MIEFEFDTSFLDITLLEELLNNFFVQIGLILTALIIAAIIGISICRAFILGKSKVAKTFRRKLILVMVPREAPQEKAGPQTLTLQQIQEKIGLMETFFSTIAGLKSEKGFKAWLFGHNDIFSFELVVHKGKTNFFIAMPAHLQSYIEEQIQAQMPSAVIEELPDYNIFTPKGVIKGQMLSLSRQSFLPIKTYKKLETDPLNGVTNALSKINEQDGAAIQIIVKSALPSWRDFGLKVLSKMQQGKKIDDAVRDVKGGWKKFWKDFWKIIKPQKSEGEKPALEQYRLSPLEEEMVKGAQEKCNKGGMDVNIRIVVSSEKPMNVDLYLNNLANAFNQYNIYKFGNAFKPIDCQPQKLIQDFIYRNFDEGRAFVLNTEELASIYHLPIPFVNEAPNIKWLDARKAQPPQNMPAEGLFMGYSVYRGKKIEVRIKREDRRRHHYIIGMTGTGKSWYMEGLCLQDIANGEGVCYIDPHGDAIAHILERIPKERAEDVVIFDQADLERQMGLNMLEFVTPEQKTFAVNELMNIFDKLYDLKATGGPMFEQYFKNACLLIMSDPESGSTLLEVPRVLSDEEFREMKLEHCDIPIVKDFWEKEAQKAGGEASLANMVPYITSKLTQFLANDFMRPIVSQQKSTLNFREAMDTRKILLVKLSKGKIGDLNAYLLGMVIVGKILMSALARGDLPEEERKDFYLYIDEFQNFLTDSMQIILAEARKYRLCLTIAHQYIGQLVKQGDTKFKDAIFGNVGTKVAFRIGVDDAEAMEKEFAGVFNRNDFLNCPMYTAYVKLLIDNANPPGFNMSTVPFSKVPGVVPANPELGAAIAKLAKLKYGRDRDLVEAEVMERMKKFG